jgi:hypothetical protein
MYRLQTTDTTPNTIVARAATAEGIAQAAVDWNHGFMPVPATVRLEEACIRCGVKVVILRRVRDLEYVRCGACDYTYRYSVRPIVSEYDEGDYEMVVELAVLS